MICAYWRRKITALIDSSLSPEESGRVRAHLESCASCRKFHSQQVRLTDLFQAVPEPTGPGPDTWDAISRRISQEKRQPAAGRWPDWLTVPQAAYAAVALFLLLGSLLIVAQRESMEVRLLAEIDAFSYSVQGNPFFGEPVAEDNPFFKPVQQKDRNPFADIGGVSK